MFFAHLREVLRFDRKSELYSYGHITGKTMKNRIPYSDALRTHSLSWRFATCILLGVLMFLPAQAARGQQPTLRACAGVTPTSLSLNESDVFGEYETFLRLTTLAQDESVYVVPTVSNPNPNVMVSISPKLVEFDEIPAGGGVALKKFRVAVLPDTDSIGGTIVINHAVLGTDCNPEGGSVTLRVSDSGAPVQGVNVSETNLITVETDGVNDGLSAEYALSLATFPSATVSVVVTSSDTLAVRFLGSDMLAEKALPQKVLQFTQDNWFEPQTLTVIAVDDSDGNDENVTISHTASGGGYDDVGIDDVAVLVVDPDPFVPGPAATVSRTNLIMHEGQTNTYTIKLETNPSEKVFIVVQPTNTAAATVSPSVLEFLPGTASLSNVLLNWNTPHTVTVTSLQDANAVSEKFAIDHIVVGGDYADVSVSSVNATIWDDEARGVTLSESGLVVNEGESATYTVGLDAFPLNTVVITPTSSAPDKLSVSPETLRFTTSVWHLQQTVTLTALRDADMDTDAVTITHQARGGGYNMVAINNITVVINDTGTVTGVEDANSTVPTDFVLEGNYPNPFNPATEIAYALPQQVHVTLTVYAASGREVRRLVNTSQAPGRYRVRWDGEDARGQPVRSGVYFYRLSTDVWHKTQSMVLLK